MIERPLTQEKLIAKLREEMEFHVSVRMVHAWIRAGMPTSPLTQRALIKENS